MDVLLRRQTFYKVLKIIQMKVIQDKPNLLDQIKEFEVFNDVQADTIQWLIDRSDYVFYPAGELLFQPDTVINDMAIVIKGRYRVQIPQGNEMRLVGTWGIGNVTGVLPFSRMRETRAFGVAIEDCYLLMCHKEHFPDLVCQDYQLTSNLVARMSNRIRNYTQNMMQSEKLMALGKISAGLAHELNNPASAMVRSAQKLHEFIHQTPERFKAVMTMRASEEQTDSINQILFDRIANRKKEELTLLEQESLKDDLIDWLEDQGIDEVEEIADTFVEFDFSEDDLEKIKEISGGDYLQIILNWVYSTLNKEALIEEINESAKRISELILSIKSYSHMDRGSDKTLIDIHEGMINTMIMLKHKFKKKNIRVDKQFDKSMPKIMAHPGELNQIWTNIIDNAIDAMDKNGMLTVKTFLDHEYVCVHIQDNGPGIPTELVNRIFEPFFTTKGVGEGTGMGLDIVRRIIEQHRGTIDVDSKPGETVFKICFPIQAI